MRAPVRILVLAATTAALIAGCSLLSNFHPAGQPCNSWGKCLDGYLCTAGNKCEPSPSPCGSCPINTRCDSPSGQCQSLLCGSIICPVGEACITDGGSPYGACSAPTSPIALGKSCSTDLDCTGPDGGAIVVVSTDGGFSGTINPRVCYRSVIASSGADSRPGICVEPCTTRGALCSGPEGATCQAFPLALDAGTATFCLPTGASTASSSGAPGLAHRCHQDTDCSTAQAVNLVCTLYDHPLIGPASFCDLPAAAAMPEGSDCGPTLPCANGLCVAENGVRTCTALCDLDGGACPSSLSCRVVETHIPTKGGVYRHVPLCTTNPSICVGCVNNPAVCGPDAPHCTTSAVPGAGTQCATYCSPDAGTISYPLCPPSYRCEANGVCVYDNDAGVCNP